MLILTLLVESCQNVELSIQGQGGDGNCGRKDQEKHGPRATKLSSAIVIVFYQTFAPEGAKLHKEEILVSLSEDFPLLNLGQTYGVL